jgi:penicillin V acylase-like amidase (Ntn superfamily)
MKSISAKVAGFFFRFFGLALAVMLTSGEGFACTTFSISSSRSLFASSEGDHFVAKNFDWGWGHGLVVVNKKDLAKKAFLLTESDCPAKWVSKYGSVTFNQVSRDLPMGGMNEAGLVVEIMVDESNDFIGEQGHPSLNELQWIQYQLDNYSSVAEVLLHLAELSVTKVMLTVHYFVCDPAGECATVEFGGGQAIVHTRQTLPVKALTNHAYEKSLDYLHGFTGFGGVKPPNHLTSYSFDRFVTAARLSQTSLSQTTTGSGSALNLIWDGLKSLEQPRTTQWSIVYDLRQKVVAFRTAEIPAIKLFQMGSFDFSCRKPTLTLDINSSETGNVTSLFQVYRTQSNASLVNESAEYLAGFLNSEQRARLVNHPETDVCQAPQ